ncbi:MAG: efflux RND transporter periplasmic adaptor subunit [Desulfomonilaceae bacterium]
MKDIKMLVVGLVALGLILAGVAANRYIGQARATTEPRYDEKDHNGREDHDGHETPAGLKDGEGDHDRDVRKHDQGKDSAEREPSGRDVDHASHDHHDGEKIVVLSDHQLKESGIDAGTASPGKLRINLKLPGEIVVNADRMAHIVPRLAGIVREVRKNLKDSVQPGEVMAVIDSRELAEAKAKYLAALKRMELAESNFNRFESLWKKDTIAEKQFLEVKTAFSEAQIELQSAQHKLCAMGFSDEYLKQLPLYPHESLTRYEIVAPFDGTVINKHITLGEMLKEDADAFVVADLSSVWVNLSVNQKDLLNVKEGQSVTILGGPGIPEARGEIAYVEPVVGERTRTALARVILPNPEGIWRPGLFVAVKVTVDSIDIPLMISKSAVQTIEGKTIAFVDTGKGFEARPLKLGRSNDSHVEIVTGLTLGERYAANGSFLFKAHLEKSKAAHAHDH